MRLIDADKIRKMIYASDDNITGDGMTQDEMDAYNDGINVQYKRIENAPTIDAISVVRCKDCKHAPHEKIIGDELYIVEPEYENGTTDCTCPYVCIDSSYTEVPNGDWFCNKGERKDS